MDIGYNDFTGVRRITNVPHIHSSAVQSDSNVIAGLVEGGITEGRHHKLFCVVTVRYGRNEIVVDVRTDQPGHLVLLEPYDPRWEVTVGGNPLVARRANGLFMSLVVPQGAFTFTFRYREPMLPLGAAAAGLGLLICLLLALRGATPGSSREEATAAPASSAPTTP